jgi:glycosyltransferase involved in cell wall biosynthesis
MMVLKKLRNRIEGAYYKYFGYPVVSCGPVASSKRALVVYLSLGMKWREDDPRFNWHQNYRQSCDIAHLLAQRGYRVDVVQYNDDRFVPADRYDLVVAHPGVVSKKLQKIPKTGFRLCLRTGRHADFVDRVIAERHFMLRQRRGRAPVWTGLAETDEVYAGYDSIVCFDGNGTTAKTFVETGLSVYSFRNYATPVLEVVEKDYQKARFGFVYMAGQLHVSKGLDWLIEAFAERPDLHLYICGKIPPELKKMYVAELSQPNLHYMGFVQLNSDKFQKICKEAAWYISPSTTDGCQGTALDAMASGLIPILSDACGVDTCGEGLRMNPCTPDTLRIALEHAALMDVGELQQQSELSRNVVEHRYRPKHFLEDWIHILDQINA